MSETPLFKCKKCSTAFSGVIPYRDHMKSKKHLEKVKLEKMQVAMMADENGQIVPDEETALKESPFKCEDCNKLFSGPIPYMHHLNGKNHYRVLRNKILSETAMDLAASIRQSVAAASSKESHEEKDEVDFAKNNTTDDAKDSHGAGVSKEKNEDNLIKSNANPPKESTVSSSELKCDICDVPSFVSLHDMMLHFESDAHRANRIAKQLDYLKVMKHERKFSSSSISSIEDIDIADASAELNE